MHRRWLSGTARLAGLCLLCASITASAADAPKASDTPSNSSQKNNPEQADSKSFGYQSVVDQARMLATKPYTPRDQIPAFLRKHSVAQWKAIEFRPDYALWQGARIPFEARFYHPGSFYAYPVAVHLVSDCAVKTLQFSPQQFDYASEKIRQKIPAQLGYAGVKLLHHLNSAEHLDEVASFLGASYFRALPKGAHYGLSARGLAVGTATESGEEFPAFTDFWLIEPQPGDQILTLYALLDSPSVAGGYKFVIDPGETTTMQVEATLFTRAAIKKLGIAPLTSMFAWGENSLHRLNHARPEAHDSDGLLIHNGNGEWLWRPLDNPQTLTINQFISESILGFGLLQRDRAFSNYQHLSYEYQDRPSLWVVPTSGWGQGRVELVQIPSDSEINDNIIVYWVPKKPIKAEQRLHFTYTLKWLMHDPSSHQRATTRATRVGYHTATPEQKKQFMKVAIEFVGGALSKLPATAKVKPQVSAARDVALEQIKAMHNPHTDGWRLSFLVPTSALDKPLDLRAFLSNHGGAPLTETWTYTLTP